MSGRKTSVTIDVIREEFRLRGAKLVTKEYLGSHQKLEFRCSKCGDLYTIEYQNFKKGINKNLLCRDCQKSVSIQQIRKEFDRKGAKLISERFENVDVPLMVKCAKCEKEFNVFWLNYKAGHNKELLCVDCRKKLGKNTCRSGKIKLEIQDTDNDGKLLYEKKLEYGKKDILFIPLYPNEKELPIVKSMLDNRNNKTKNIVYARKCEIEELETGKEFLKENHIQGYRKADVTVGLYYKDMLVCCMSFVKVRYNKEYEYELLRLATKQGYEVVGGATKMFSYFVKKYEPKSIISYCDVRFCNVEPKKTVYEKLGFEYLYKTQPNYRYYTNDLSHFYTRQACQKHRLKELLGDRFDPGLTEEKNMKIAGYKKIYDCGNYVFGWKNLCS